MSKKNQFSIRLEGAEELEQALKQLGSRVEQKQTMINAASAGGKVLADEMNRRLNANDDVDFEVEQAFESGAMVAIGPVRDKFYLIFRELGVKPHWIEPLNRAALRFFGRDGFRFAQRVFHPGLSPRPFMRPALDSKKNAAVDAVGDYFRGVIEKVMGK